jgi:hypothetical protein
MASIRGHVKIHDSRKGNNQQDEEKKVELKTQTPHGRQNFPEEYSMHITLSATASDAPETPNTR